MIGIDANLVKVGNVQSVYEAVRECPFSQTLHYAKKNYPRR